MRLFFILLFCLPVATQATIFKCLDKAGQVTYTNAGCDKSGMSEAKILSAPPPPAIDAPKPGKTESRIITPAPKAADVANTPTQAVSQRHATAQLSKAQVQKTPPPASANCAILNNQLGQVMDEMDAARHENVLSGQVAEWDSRLAQLQSEKSKLGCF